MVHYSKTHKLIYYFLFLFLDPVIFCVDWEVSFPRISLHYDLCAFFKLPHFLLGRLNFMRIHMGMFQSLSMISAFHSIL